MKLSRREFLQLSAGTIAYLSLPGIARAEKVAVPVLMYHDISNQFRDPYTTTPSLFATQMEWLYASGFRAVSIQEALKLRRNSDEKIVVITFDDGYASFLDYAFPLLEGYGFKATIALIGASVGSTMMFEGTRPMLSWDEYRFLVKSGVVDLACHTYNLHSFLKVRGIGEAELSADLTLFQETLEREVGRRSELLAWPFGFYRKEWIPVARRAGFNYLFTSHEDVLGGGSDTTEIPRLAINSKLDLVSFQQYLGGS